MKRTIISAVLFAALPLSAQAGNCIGSAFQVDAATELAGNTVCAYSGTDTWQEWHQGSAVSGGTLTEYARGAGHPIDPSHDVGSWAPAPDGAITYNYTDGGSYTFELWRTGGGSGFYAFCEAGPGTALIATVSQLKIGGPVACTP